MGSARGVSFRRQALFCVFLKGRAHAPQVGISILLLRPHSPHPSSGQVFWRRSGVSGVARPSSGVFGVSIFGANRALGVRRC